MDYKLEDNEDIDTSLLQPKKIHTSIGVNHHQIDFNSIKKNKLADVLLHKSDSRANTSELVILLYSISDKKSKFPIQPLYNCYFLLDKKPTYVQPIIKYYGKEVEYNDVQNFFTNNTYKESEKNIYIEEFMKPLNDKIDSFESLKELARKYRLGEEVINVIEGHKASMEKNSFLNAWRVLRKNIQQFYNVRIAFLEGNHRAVTASSILNQLSLSGNLCAPREIIAFATNNSTDLFQCPLHDKFKTLVFWSLHSMTPMECKSYSRNYRRGQDKNFPRTYLDDQVQLLDLWKDCNDDYGLNFKSALGLQFPGKMQHLKETLDGHRNVEKTFYSKASQKLHFFLEKVVDIVLNFSCEDIKIDKSEARKEIFISFFGSGFLTTKSAEKNRTIDGKGDTLPRKIRVFLDIYRLCLFDKSSMTLLEKIIYKGKEMGNNVEENESFNAESLFLLILYCIYDTSDRVMKMVKV